MIMLFVANEFYARRRSFGLLVLFFFVSYSCLNVGASPAAELRPVIKSGDSLALEHPLTIAEAVKIATTNYPKLLKARNQLELTTDALRLQKINEYMPEALFQYQEIMASRNKITQIFYGSPVFPALLGPDTSAVSMRPLFFSGGGFNLDWQPIDFGLHKARIGLKKAAFRQSAEDMRVTELDTAVSAALNFLDAVVAKEQIQAAQENLKVFEQIKASVDAQVNSKLRAAADSYLAEAELARARNVFVRARLSEKIALSNLANAMGVAGKNIGIDAGVLDSYVERNKLGIQNADYESSPLVSAGKAVLSVELAQKAVLDKQYYPVFHWLFGMQLRGAGLNVKGKDQSANVNGLFPCVPNYQIAMIMNWNFLDFARIQEENKILNQRLKQSRLDLDLVRNNLNTEDFRTREQLEAAYQLVENARTELESADLSLKQSETRYKNGLSSVVPLAEASQKMAQARLELAQAHVNIWKVLLAISALRGDLKPFLSLVANAGGS